MKQVQIIVFAALIALPLMVRAGGSIQSPVEIEGSGGTFTATGSLASARFSDNDVELIGCRLLGTAGVGSDVHCVARDSAGTTVTCFSTDAFIIEAVQAISAYSWLRIEAAGGDCTHLYVSTRSQHIPDQRTQSGKKSK